VCELDAVLGLGLEKAELPALDLDAEIEALVQARERARRERDFARADAIRDDLRARGIALEDTPQGVRWRRA
jgi:cysteinyl-tRNA synthetase